MKIKSTKVKNAKRSVKIPYLGVLMLVSTMMGALPASVFANELEVQQEEMYVSGKVTDNTGFEIPGATVLEKGTTNGVVTDIDGGFTLKVSSEDAILVISYLGYVTQEIIVGGQTDIAVILETDISALDEVVVIGFGTKIASEVVSSIGAIKAEELQVTERPVTNVASALQGSIPGLIVNTSSGSPGSVPLIRIRGESSLNNGNDESPVLVIIDNFEGSLADIDPQTVESVSVLKDAAAVAIYGARGANGVIVVTTNQPQRDKKISVSYNFSTSIQNKPSLPTTLNSLEYYEYQNSIIEIENQYQLDQDPAYVSLPLPWSDDDLSLASSGFYPETVWADELYDNTATQQSHNLTLSGGSANTGYSLTASYLNQEGLIVGDDSFEKLNLRLRINSDINDWLTVGTNVLISNRTDFDVPVTTGSNIRGLPTLPVVSEDGYWVANGTVDTRANVVAEASSGSFVQNDLDRVNLQLFAQAKPIKGLTIEQRASIIKTNQFNRDWSQDYDNIVIDPTDPDSYTNPDSPNRTYLLETPETRELILNSYTQKEFRFLTSARYKLNIDEHDFEAFVGFQTESGEAEEFETGRINFVSDDLIALGQGEEISPNVGGAIGNAETIAGNATTLSLFGRVSYSFRDTYLLEASFRRDGTSYFTEENRIAFFPSAAVGWIVTNESFMQDIDVVNQLKLRASYGVTGDDSGLGAATQQLVTYSAAGYPIGDVISGSLSLPSILNPNLIWETSTILDFGIDAAFLDGKLEFQVDYFKNERRNILAAITTTAFEVGFGDALANPYGVDSWGWEFSATHRNKIGDFNYSISANFTDYDNEIVQLTEDAIAPNFQEGQSISDRFGYTTDGFFDSQEEIESYQTADGVLIDQSGVGGSYIGGLKFVDQITVDTDGDGILDAADGIINGDDQVVLEENSSKNLNFGMNLSVGYKNITLSARFYGTFDNNQWLNTTNASTPFLGNAVPFTYHTDVWSPTNQDALYPRLTTNNANLDYALSVDRLIIDAEYVKLQNLTLNYTFGKKVLDKIAFINALSIYTSVENIGVIWTNSPLYEHGWDPELGVSNVNYPLALTTSFGLNIKF